MRQHYIDGDQESRVRHRGIADDLSNHAICLVTAINPLVSPRLQSHQCRGHERRSITVVARPVVELRPGEDNPVLVEINNRGMIVPLSSSIELNGVGDDPTYEPEAFFGTVEKQIKKRPL